MRVLVVSEKPRMARTIAHALGDYRARRIGRVTAYDLQYNGDSITVFPLMGHIKDIQTAPRYRRWSGVDPLVLLTDRVALVKIVSKPGIVRALKKELQHADMIVISTDPDEEGENIGMEALEVAREMGDGFAVKRLWLPTTSATDIRRRWGAMVEPKMNLAYAVEARRYLDALVGFSATRELSLKLQHLTRRLGTYIVSVGRCQTALLWLIYRREKEIHSFVPEPFWQVQAQFSAADGVFHGVHVASPFKEEDKARKVYEASRAAGEGVVLSCQDHVVEEPPPTPLNTSKMLQMVVRNVGVTAARAMQLAEDLYLEGYITYPRTNTDRYTAFSHRLNLERLSTHTILGGYAKQLLDKGMVRPRNGRVYEGDHEPITPIQPLSPGGKTGFSEHHYRVYELILRRYLALFGPPARISRAEVMVDVAGETFLSRGLRVIEPGFMTVYSITMPKEVPIPRLAEGDRVKVVRVDMVRDETKPPPRYSEADLIRLMTQERIGTKSTRPQFIEILRSRRYIEGFRVLKPTRLGYVLAEQLEAIWPEFVRPTFTTKIEVELSQVAEGRKDWRQVVEEGRMLFMKMLVSLREKMEVLADRIGEGTQRLVEAGRQPHA
jgi:DNA topoisomerase-1